MSYYVYAIVEMIEEGCEPTPLVKIGISKNPEKRAEELAAGNSRGLEVFSKRDFKHYASARSAETRIHAALKYFQVYREWFHITPEGAAAVIEVA